MKEEFVSNGLARKLLAKGCPLDKVYRSDGARPLFYELPLGHPEWQDCDAWYVPTIAQVLGWLREEKKIYMVVTPYPSMSTKDNVIWCYQIKRNSDGACMETMGGLVSYMDYRGAVIDGIEYVLDNLI